MNLAAVAAAPEPVAFLAYFSLVSPAMRDVAGGPLRRARHGGRPCSGADGTRWCDECERTIDDHLLGGYTRLRDALAGTPPRTRAGEAVREMDAVARWVTSPEAAVNDIDLMARLIRRRPGHGEPTGVRAARAQLVHHPLRNIEARTCREDAMGRGASAQPLRDLGKSDWARPLRDDETSFALLTDAITRLRNGARDPYDIPADLLDRHHLDPLAARRSLRAALDRLRVLRPGFFMANVTIHLEQGEFFPELFPGLDHNPEDLLILGEEKELARRTLSTLLVGERSANWGACHRGLLAGICADVPAGGAELVARAARDLGIDPRAADRFVRRLVSLVSLAGQDWVAHRLPGAENSRSGPEDPR
ncbi:hypothetical protein OG339_24210 [Streptosporangium sp. NBC_01495]|uniref:hypothetical protein n=1 Tax=Streptosporangium sp. NBC_01495 TaxID=2903899 RepID=UPI002E3013FD|nr:hypothetical protein [Streptosporangium sp. NBC_01495]